MSQYFDIIIDDDIEISKRTKIFRKISSIRNLGNKKVRTFKSLKVLQIFNNLNSFKNITILKMIQKFKNF